jgi:hypothetical protein
MWLALALLKDAARASDVTTYLEKNAPSAVQVVRECNRGAHSGALARDLTGFIRNAERLTKLILEKS